MATRENRLCRRELLKATAATVAAGFSGVAGGMFQNSVAGEAEISASEEVKRLARRLPRWRGFNLMEKISADSIMRAHADPLPGNQPFREQDFEWIAELGFDFVRLPMDYHCWADPEDPYRLLEKKPGGAGPCGTSAASTASASSTPIEQTSSMKISTAIGWIARCWSCCRRTDGPKRRPGPTVQ